MGLFDSLTSDPDQQRALMQGLLSGAFGAMAGRGSRLQAWGQGGLAGLMGYQGSLDKTAQAKQQSLQNERQALQDQLLRGQLGQQQRQAQIQALPGQFYRAPSMPGVDATGGMETAMENPANQASPEGRFDMGGYQNALFGLDPVQALQLKAMTEPKKAAPIKGSPGDVFFDQATGKPLFGVPAAPQKSDAPSAVKEYEYAKQQGYTGTFEQWTTAQKKAGATNIPINLGQKGLDNTLKLRGDFRQEPIYKAHQDVQSAYAQISQSLKQQSPAGDLAGATKIMKILDPGSVVRESELGMAMAASGLMDRVTNYADMVLKGTKLTPTQRKDFQTLADALYQESAKIYDAKRNEYKGIAERNQLPVEDVLGPPQVSPTKVRKYNPATGRIE